MSGATDPALSCAFAELRAELESSPFVVELFPAPRPAHAGHCVRVASSVPPAWYRAMCRAYPSARGTRRGKFDTRIRRANVLRALGRMAEGAGTRSPYAFDLLRVALRRLRVPTRKASALAAS